MPLKKNPILSFTYDTKEAFNLFYKFNPQHLFIYKKGLIYETILLKIVKQNKLTERKISFFQELFILYHREYIVC